MARTKRMGPGRAGALALALCGGTAAAQDGAYDVDPYFAAPTLGRGAAQPRTPQASLPSSSAPPRASQGQTERADTLPRALPRPRGGAGAPAYTGAAPQAYAAPSAVSRPAPRAYIPAQDAPRASASPRAMGGDASDGVGRPLTAYVEARTGWDGPRGAARDDGILYGVTGGFDRVITRMAGGRLHAGLLASVDLSTARRANASVTRDETGMTPQVTLTEAPTSETRDIEVGARLGWRRSRFSFYAMAALSNRKRETETITTVFTESPAPTDDDQNAVTLTPSGQQTTGISGLFADGWRVGAGVEAQLYGPAYLHVGYRYSDYDEGGDRHQVLTGLGARF